MTSTDPYYRFLSAKVRVAGAAGFIVDPSEVHPMLLPHQRAAVVWACAGGRRALFEKFGLGKTMQQLEILRLCRKHQGGGAVGVVLPYGVRQEFRQDAEKLGIATRFVQTTEEVDPDFDGIHLTNYESVREGKIDPAAFVAVSLDEASVLRSYGSKTYQTFLPLFATVLFRFVATATPSPNRYKELIHYAGFLGIMDTGQALTRWFKRDSAKANNLTLYPHKEREFWLWVASWALFLQKPSDLGFDDTGYDLPAVNVHFHEVAVEHTSAKPDRDGQGNLFRDAALGIVEAAREKRDTLTLRVSKVAELLAAEPGRHAVIWHDLEAERLAIEAAVPNVVSVFGDMGLDPREAAIVDFAHGRFPYLNTKPILAGSGCNFQRHCSMAIYAGIGFKFNDFIQSVHRLVRYLQTAVVDIHIVHAESERNVVRDLMQKWARHNELVEKMSQIIREYGLSAAAMANVLQRAIGVERIEVVGEGWQVANNDCVLETRGMADDSVDLIVTSIPFANHYEYSPSYNDMGHTDDNAHFWAQMDFLTPELLRVLKPGRIACIHVKDRIQFGSVTGAGIPTVSPFHAETIAHYCGMPALGVKGHGFDNAGMITVVTDVVRENNQTYRLSYGEMCKDGSKMGVGSPEYVVILHKPQSNRSKGYADSRIQKSKDEYSLARWQVDAHAYWRSSGDRSLTADELATFGPEVLAKLFTTWTLHNVYDFESHVRIGEELQARGALPTKFMALAPGSNHPDVWHDVNRMLTLNGEQTRQGLENHICPLQFDIVDRLIERYSQPGELVYDPFGGLFTVPLRAITLGRRGRAAELSTSYFFDGVKHLQVAERKLSMPGLFDALDADAANEPSEAAA